MSWRELVPGCGLLLQDYFCSSFGPANALAIPDADGGMAVLSPPPLNGEACAAALPYPVRSLIVPNIAHRSGLKSWISDYGDLPVHAPDMALEPLRRSGFDARPLLELKPASGITVMEPAGARTGLTFVRSLRGERAVCYLDEVVINLARPPKSLLSRLLFGLYGVASGPRVNDFFLKILCSDGEAVLSQARDFAAPGALLLGAHGGAIEIDADRLLQPRKAAA